MALQGRLFAGLALCVGVSLAQGGAFAQTPATPAGLSLELSLGPVWESNPLELTRRAKGDGGFAAGATLAYRWMLWKDAALSLSGTGSSTAFLRDSAGGANRIAGLVSFSQRWQGFSLSLSAAARTAMDQHLSSHDSASQEVTLGLSRALMPAKDWTLIPSIGIARRFHQDGSEDQLRARLGLVLVYRRDKWRFRAFGGFGWALEDKTPILPRINDRTISGGIGVSYEWARDRDVSIRLNYSRTFSSYAPNRTLGWTLAPKVAATLRF